MAVSVQNEYIYVYNHRKRPGRIFAQYFQCRREWEMGSEAHEVLQVSFPCRQDPEAELGAGTGSGRALRSKGQAAGLGASRPRLCQPRSCSKARTAC